MKAVHFKSASAFRAWLKLNHAKATELVVGFFNKASGKSGLTYAEALDEALCYGWIDGIRRRVDADSYSIRFTPRRAGSIWSRVNIGHVERLKKAGRMQPAGLAAYAIRDEKKTGLYSFEKRPQRFPAELESVFRAATSAWAFWQAQPPGYQRLTIHWVTSAKQEPTRLRRLEKVIASSTEGQRL